MAMRWSSSSAARSVPRPRTVRVLGTLVAVACVSTVTRSYLPDPGNPRFDTERATAVIEQYLRAQCPERLAAKKADSGDASLVVRIDSTGAVTRADLTSSSGDETLDGVFGTVAAQLQLDSLRATAAVPRTTRVKMGFSCANDAAVATIELLDR